jgi:hypothetical protein
MKKIDKRIRALLWIGAFLWPAPAPATTISVSGHQLLVNCQAFLVKGMNYSPVPIGDGVQEWATNFDVVQADLAQMKAMGVNAIRVYFDYYNSGAYAGLFYPDGTPNPAMKANYDRAIAAAAANGIYVVPDFWLPQGVDLSNAATLTQVEGQFEAVINLFKDSAAYPNILLWALGNENNASGNLGPMSSTQLFQTYQTILSHAKANADNTHPYTVVLVNNGDINNASLTSLVPSIDLWSLNVYQPTSSIWNSNVIGPYNLPKPLLITEFGNDAYNSYTLSEDDTDQNTFFNDIWSNSVGPNLSALNASKVLAGACVFEWNDEWWKCTNNWTHMDCGQPLPVLPDNYGNEEWFGLSAALPIGNTGPRSYRPAYNMLQSYWIHSPYNTTVSAACGTSPTPTSTASPTPSPTPNSACVSVFDDFNNGAGVTDAFGGTWTTYFGSGGGVVDFQNPGVVGYSMRFAYGINPGGYGEAIAPLNAGASPNGAGTNTHDISNYGQVSFWATSSAPSTFQFLVASVQNPYGGANYSWWQAPFTAGPSWTPVTLNFDQATFQNPNGNTGTLLQNMKSATSFVILQAQPGNGYLWVDEIKLVLASCLATHTFTATPSTTPTGTPTPTASATPTRTPTASTTATPSATASSTSPPSPSRTPTTSSTPTGTPSASPIPTQTSTCTYTNSPTETPAATATVSMTPTASPTGTATSSSTPSAVFTPTDSPSPTPTRTPTASPTMTRSMTPMASPTATWTASSSSTSTAQVTATPTASPSHTPTAVPPTSTRTPTATLTFTPSPIPTFTPPLTSTPIFSWTGTPTPEEGVVIGPVYPDPSDGRPVFWAITVPGPSRVTWDVFTTAFRKITEDAVQVSKTATLHWDLEDRMGNPVASGLYYVRIQVQGLQSETRVLKVLVIR